MEVVKLAMDEYEFEIGNKTGGGLHRVFLQETPSSRDRVELPYKRVVVTSTFI